jgi:hypothetical protein
LLSFDKPQRSSPFSEESQQMDYFHQQRTSIKILTQTTTQGYAVDLTDDPKLGGIDCADIFQKLKEDKRVKYLIFKGKIWSVERAS